MEALYIFFAGFLQQVFYFIRDLWFIWLPVSLFFIFWEFWMLYVNLYYVANIPWMLLEVKIPRNIMVDLRRIDHIPDNQLIILCTGSQGEEYSALVRMASGEHKQVKIRKGDTVVISASAIPGNERTISDTVNNLFKEVLINFTISMGRY